MDDTRERGKLEAEKILCCLPWLKKPDTSINTYRYLLMESCGFERAPQPTVPGKAQIFEQIFTGDHPTNVIARARTGDRIAHEALLSIARFRTDRNMPLPHILQDYIVGAAEAPPVFKRGRHPIANRARDEHIWLAVEVAIEAGLPQTSAFSVVAEVLEKLGLAMSEENVGSSWRKGKGWVDPPKGP